MMRDFIIPDYQRCNLNISATLAEFLGAPNKNATLPILKEQLDKNYKNIAFICFDGLGLYPMQKNLSKDDFLMQSIKQILVSTFPSTTTNATTSLLQNQLPLEHGWFGWSMYYKELNKNIDIFLNKDSLTGEKIDCNNSPLGKLDYYFDNANTDYAVNTIFPHYVQVAHPERNNVYYTFQDFFEIITAICRKPNKQFIYAYYPEPDTIMHEYGVCSIEAKSIIKNISKNLNELYNNSEDTLFIVSADHGQIDIEGYVNLYEDKALMNMLQIYPFMEARAPAFIVKENRKCEFEEYFRTKYSKDFVLHKSEDLVKKGYFGDFGNKEHLLGDYIAIGTYTHKQAILAPYKKKFKGHHTSLTEEMEVPLIILNK